MPCQSYDNEWDSGSSERKIRELKKQADMLARIACKALTELEKNEVADLLILKDDEVATWWKKHKEDDAREAARLAEIERKKRVKEEALARLSDEEKELLGLATKKSLKRKSSGKGLLPDEYDKYDQVIEVEYRDWGEEIEELEQKLEEAYHKLTDGTVVKTFKVR